MNFYEKLKDLSQKRVDFLEKNPGEWYSWDTTYFQALINELAEVKMELKHDNTILLEDELADVFWCQMCLMHALKNEWKIKDVDGVIQRAYEKFSQRVGTDGLGVEKPWNEIKQIQKEELKDKHNRLYKK